MKCIAIGDNDMITGFRLVGVQGKEATSSKQTLDALKEALARRDLAIIILSQDFSAEPQIQQEISKIRKERTVPLIVEFPSGKGDAGETSLSQLVSKSLGVRM
jgi:V/A-type H+-transporting ATPase subunit F